MLNFGLIVGSVRSFTYRLNRSGESTSPCLTPLVTGKDLVSPSVV